MFQLCIWIEIHEYFFLYIPNIASMKAIRLKEYSIYEVMFDKYPVLLEASIFFAVMIPKIELLSKSKLYVNVKDPKLIST